MNETFVHRFAAMGGLGLAAAFALWWLGSARLAIDQGGDAARSSADALHIAWLVRALLVPSAMALFGRWNWWLPEGVARVFRVEPSPLQDKPAPAPAPSGR